MTGRGDDDLAGAVKRAVASSRCPSGFIPPPA